MSKQIVLSYAGALFLASGLSLCAQTPPPRPPLTIRSLVGQDLFGFYCATCHGRDGTGNGPVAAALTEKPPDLTTLSRRQGGTFPRQRVQMFVTHDGSVLAPAHGSADMPVWGPVFRGLDASDTLTDIRITNLVDYIQSIQSK